MSPVAPNQLCREIDRVSMSDTFRSSLSESSTVLSEPMSAMLFMATSRLLSLMPYFRESPSLRTSFSTTSSFFPSSSLSAAVFLIIALICFRKSSSFMPSPMDVALNVVHSSMAASTILTDIRKLSCSRAASIMLCASSTITTMSLLSASMLPMKVSRMLSERMCIYGATMTSADLMIIFLAS